MRRTARATPTGVRSTIPDMRHGTFARRLVSPLSCTGLMLAVAAAQPPSSRLRTAARPAPPDVAAPPADAAKTASGLASKVLQNGKGDKKPGAQDMVTVHYTGWTTDGKMFDSSHSRGKPSTFRRRPGHQGLGRGRAADGHRREAAAVDSAGSGLSRPAGTTGRACWSSTSSSRDRAESDGRAAGRRRAAGGRATNRRPGSPTEC